MENTVVSNSSVIEVDPNLPILSDKEFYVDYYENIKSFLYKNVVRPVSTCYMNHPKIIGCSIFLLILLGGICGVLFVKKTNQYPCLQYSDTDLASTVSLECLNYLWTISCRPDRQFNPSNTWWRNSPEGTSKVKCDATHTGSLCGAGSYQHILSGIILCNPNYKG